MVLFLTLISQTFVLVSRGRRQEIIHNNQLIHIYYSSSSGQQLHGIGETCISHFMSQPVQRECPSSSLYHAISSHLQYSDSVITWHSLHRDIPFSSTYQSQLFIVFKGIPLLGHLDYYYFENGFLLTTFSFLVQYHLFSTVYHHHTSL